MQLDNKHMRESLAGTELGDRIKNAIAGAECKATQGVLKACEAEIYRLSQKIERQNLELKNPVSVPAPDDNTQCKSLFMMLALFGKHLKRVEGDLQTMSTLHGFEHCDDYKMARQEYDKYVDQIKTIALASARLSP